MNDNKTNLINQLILRKFLENEMITTNQLAEETNLSEKTIRTKIEGINSLLINNNLGEICKKPRIGMWLNANEDQRQKIMIMVMNSDTDMVQNNHERLSLALRQILRISKTNNLTTRQLADSLYLSVPTATKVINDCKEWLASYHIELKTVRNKGFIISCSESSYRLALKDYITTMDNTDLLDQTILYFMPGLNLESIKKCIITTEKEWGFSLAENSFNEIYVYLCIAIYRSLKNERSNLSFTEKEISLLSQYNEYHLSESLYKFIQNEYNIKIPVDEIAFLSIQILCSKMINHQEPTDTQKILKEYDLKLETFVKKLISVVSSVTDINLTNDEVLYHGLLIHLKPTIFRLRYERPYANELKGYIKTEFSQTMRVSWIISILFQEYFELKITEDELSYIALYIQAALDRNSKPLDVVLVSVSSMGINQMTCDKIQRAIHKIRSIEVVSFHDFKIENYTKENLIITTKKLNINDDRIVEINEFVTDQTLLKIQEKISQLQKKRSENEVHFDAACHQLFEPDLIFTKLNMTDKKNILKFMCQQLSKKGYVTSKYFQSVIDRENITPTSIGCKVAIPHGEQNEVHEAKVVVATLSKPILWDTEMVDVIFLLAVKMTSDFEIERTQNFYKKYIHLVDTDEKVNVLRNFKTNIEFYSYLVR